MARLPDLVSRLWCAGPASGASDSGRQGTLSTRSLSADSERHEGRCYACARLARCWLPPQWGAGDSACVVRGGSLDTTVGQDYFPTARVEAMGCQLSSDSDAEELKRSREGSKVCASQWTKSLKNGHLVQEYKIGEMLGQGAFGIVFAAKRRKGDGSDEKLLAVKLIDKVETHPEDIEREANIHAQMEHPNILKVHDVIDERFFVCIVTDRYLGGDLVKCLREWKRRLKPSKTMHMVKQMLEAVNYLHNLSVAHRDVKADNFLVDQQDFLDSSSRIILADFGFACYCRVGDRLQRRCGTKLYWAPEIWDRNYALKVDVWAVGVTVYGMMEGTFPFHTEWDVKSRAVTCHPMMSPKCLDFVLKLLGRAEARRPTAAQAMEHKWLVNPASSAESAGPGGHGVPQGHQSDANAEDWAPDPPDLEVFRAEKLDPAVTERRLELVERLERPNRFAEDMSASSCDSIHRTPSVTLRRRTFVVTDRRARKQRTFEWWPCSRVEQEVLGALEAKREDQVPRQESQALEYVNTQLLAHVLQDHGIDTTQFGTGGSKTLQRLALEVESGASRLMLDASMHKALVRVVEVVLLRLSHCDEDSGCMSYLVVTADVQVGGQVRSELNRLPGTKKKPHENLREATQRILLQIPNPDSWDNRIECNFRGREVFEEETESPSFPGVRTIYRTEVVTARTDVRFAIEGAGRPQEDSGDAAGNETSRNSSASTKLFSWMTEEECVRLSVKLRAPDQSADVSSLVPAPIGLKVRALERYLRANSVDPSLFGRGQAKTLQELSAELTSGESSLMASPQGGLVRLVDVVLLKIFEARRREVLVVTRSKHDEVEEVGLNRLPGSKRRQDENQFLAAKRVLSRQLLLSEDCVKLDEGVHIVQEDKDSPSYPGLRTVYVKRIISVELFIAAEHADSHVLSIPGDASQS